MQCCSGLLQSAFGKHCSLPTSSLNEPQSTNKLRILFVTKLLTKELKDGRQRLLASLVVMYYEGLP